MSQSSGKTRCCSRSTASAGSDGPLHSLPPHLNGPVFRSAVVVSLAGTVAKIGYLDLAQDLHQIEDVKGPTSAWARLVAKLVSPQCDRPCGGFRHSLWLVTSPCSVRQVERDQI
jgi:hypothetical protein